MKIEKNNIVVIEPGKAPDGFKTQKTSGFEKIFSKEINEQIKKDQEESRILLGTVSKKMPTVSHLLNLKNIHDIDIWETINSRQNANLPYTRIPSGTDIFINVKTHEIEWDATKKNEKQGQILKHKHIVEKFLLEHNDNNFRELGVITETKPTVSHLLVDHPKYRNNCWDIVHLKENSHLPYTHIPDGTQIFINPETLEIRWDMDGSLTDGNGSFAANEPEANECSVLQEKESLFSGRLAKAVSAYMGVSYDKIDCYELIIKALNDMGIRYHGHGGLKERLMNMAIHKGMPAYSFLNGEGLIKAVGSDVYTKNLKRVSDWKAQSKKFYDEMSPLLQKGMILSFSTPTRGHTGIISKKNTEWTFLNSGIMDNNLHGKGLYKGVGEENLIAELENWLKLADHNNESIDISLGKLKEEKMALFSPGSYKSGKRV